MSVIDPQPCPPDGGGGSGFPLTDSQTFEIEGEGGPVEVAMEGSATGGTEEVAGTSNAAFLCVDAALASELGGFPFEAETETCIRASTSFAGTESGAYHDATLSLGGQTLVVEAHDRTSLGFSETKYEEYATVTAPDGSFAQRDAIVSMDNTPEDPESRTLDQASRTQDGFDYYSERRGGVKISTGGGSDASESWTSGAVTEGGGPTGSSAVELSAVAQDQFVPQATHTTRASGRNGDDTSDVQVDVRQEATTSGGLSRVTHQVDGADVVTAELSTDAAAGLQAVLRLGGIGTFSIVQGLAGNPVVTVAAPATPTSAAELADALEALGWIGPHTVPPTMAVAGAAVATDQATASAAYVDLATVGPAVVNYVVPSSGAVVVTLTAAIDQSAATAWGLMSFAMSGVNTAAANDAFSIVHHGSNFDTRGGEFYVSGLNPGPTTFTAKYRADNGGTANFLRRHITVVGAV